AAARHFLRRDGAHGIFLHLDQELRDAGADSRSDSVDVQPARQDDFGAGDLDLRRYADARIDDGQRAEDWWRSPRRMFGRRDARQSSSNVSGNPAAAPGSDLPSA